MLPPINPDEVEIEVWHRSGSLLHGSEGLLYGVGDVVVTRQQIMCHRSGEPYMPTDTSQPSRHSEWLSEKIYFFWTLFMVLIFREYDVSGADSISGFR